MEADRPPLLRLEQIPDRIPRPPRRRQPQMRPGLRRQHPPARRPLDQALLQQVGLDHLLDRVARLGQRRRRSSRPRPARRRSFRPAAAGSAGPRRRARGRPPRAGSAPGRRSPASPCRRPRPARSPPRAAAAARRSAACPAPAARSPRPVRRRRARPHQPRRPRDDLVQLRPRVEFEPRRDAEPVAQRRRQQTRAASSRRPA